MSQKPIDLHYWPTPNGWKISIALEEMGLAYEVKRVDISQGEQFAPAFLKISPNNRMPAIVDPDGPDGLPISVFESGAILQYLGRKTGMFYPSDARQRVEVDQWLHWQMSGLGPMAGQASHFRLYAPSVESDAGRLEYGRARYTNEVNRLYGVLDRRLEDRDYLAGEYSIADMASWPWTRGWKLFGQNLDDFPNMKRWSERIRSRPAVDRAVAIGKDWLKPLPKPGTSESEAAKKLMFSQTAQTVRNARTS